MSAQASELVAGLRPPEITEVVAGQVFLPAYLAPTVEPQGRATATYDSNETAWSDVLARKLNVASHVRLEGFELNEWMPFSAGTFHTDHGRHEREHARQLLLYDGRSGTSARPSELQALVPGIDPRSLGPGKIYSSAGKGGMIAGGVGCVRLKPRRLNGDDVWFASATSSSVAHEGMVVAIPADIYRRHVDELADKGSVRCTLVGELRFVENEFRDRYGTGVPQLYLLASELTRLGRPAEPLRVSVPISFQGADGSVNAAYANFWAGETHGVDRAARWLEDIYVRQLYKGTVITDFDEQVSWFAKAELALETVMAGTLDPQRAGAVARRLGLGEHMTTVIIERVELNGTLTAGRIETVSQDRVINIGEGAHVGGNVVIANEIQGSFNNIQQLPDDRAELRELLEQLAKAVEETARTAPEGDAKTLGMDLERLTKELAADAPRRRWYELSLDSLQETATKLGAIGIPIIELATKVAALI
jgi:hypothetical protein